MASRRTEMVILTSVRPLESIKRLLFKAESNNDKITHMSKQFIPMFRFHNPHLQVDFERVDAEASIIVEYNDDSVSPVVIPIDSQSSVHALAQQVIDSDRKKIS